MNIHRLQLALRELRSEFSHPVLWVILVGIASILTFGGAFGTGDVLRPVPLLLYWLLLVVLTYGAGSLISALLRPMLDQQHRAVRIAVLGLITSGVVTALVIAVNWSAFGADWITGPSFMRFVASTMGVALVVTLMLDFVLGRLPAEAQAQAQVPSQPETEPALMGRLPVAKRGALMSLTAVDHYVEVTTDKGAELVLIRLSDAMALTAPVAGLQIHRSHWVALDQIADVTPGAGKASVTLKDGRVLPVSRANVAKVREAGLLP